MDGSKLDYRHRPAKNIERHLIVETLRRTQAIFRADYQYVGFGAVEFIDFQLVHRSLALRDMVSIEKKDTERHEFNKPFKSIRILTGQSNELFRRKEIDLSRPTILWLDYTTVLKPEIIDDLLQVARIVSAPTFLLVTLNAQETPVVAKRLETYEANVTTEYRAPGLTNSMLSKHGLGRAQRSSVEAVLAHGLKQRRDTGIQWSQVLNIHYADGQLMQTIGGLMLPVETSTKTVRQAFQDLDTFRPGEDYLDLRVPMITARERAHLDRQLPKKSPAPLRARGIPGRDLEDYRKVYRYLHLAGLQSAAETTWTE